jgi:hypothetical protein
MGNASHNYVMLLLEYAVSREVELAWALDYKPGSRL